MLLVIALALADVAPEPGFVETCTPAVCGAGQASTTCSASFQGRPDCQALEAQGWVKSCQTRGASVWTEVLCKPGAEGTAPATPATPAPKGCGAAQGAGGLLLFGGLAAWLRKRSPAA